MRKLIVVFAIASILAACGPKKGDDQPTITTTPLNGDWIAAGTSTIKYGFICDTRLIVGEGKAFLGETCDHAFQNYHVVAFGSLEVVGDVYEIKTEAACPPLEGVSFPSTKGKFTIALASSNTKYLSLASEDGTKKTDFNQILKEQAANAAKVGCLEVNFMVMPNESWNNIANFISRVLAPINSPLQ
ncbi:MAG: hypothetical protein HQK54_00125 [Oligoflexales bacterium]|nr:hypothetical protein [Oligoflexales bacterium]